MLMLMLQNQIIIQKMWGGGGVQQVSVKNYGGLQLVLEHKHKHSIIAGGLCSVFNPYGGKLRSFGTHGSGEGEFQYPCGVAVDRDGNILVADYQPSYSKVHQRRPFPCSCGHGTSAVSLSHRDCS